jgi:Zn-finger nucleic acid-binding protein
MSALKLTAKFRMKDKVPFSIETLSGKQFRCGVCRGVYFSLEELEKHLRTEKNKDYDTLQFPEVDKNISINVIYTQDIRDLTNPKYPKLQKGDKLFNPDRTGTF